MNKLHLTVEPGQSIITSTREFDAPRDLVFRAYTEPELTKKWWAGKYNMKIDTMEVRPGGSWRYITSDDEGNEFNFHGVFHDITSPERIIQTFEFEGMPEKGHVSLDTAYFEDLGDKTKLTVISSFQSVEDRDGMIDSGMEEGYSASLEALEALLDTMKGK